MTWPTQTMMNSGRTSALGQVRGLAAPKHGTVFDQRELLEQIVQAARSDAHMTIDEGPITGSGTVVVLAPHPDDPESSAVLQRMLLNGGWGIRWVVLTSAWSGVRDEFVGPDKEAKAAARRTEQTESARLFGLGVDRLTFLNLPETPEGQLDDYPDSYSVAAGVLDKADPRIIVVPWGKDTNRTHRLVYEWLGRWIESRPQPVIVFSSEDPKSVDFSPNLAVRFDEGTARWKASLLECHRSQTERNLATRGCTFSERILATNARDCSDGSRCYSERYRVSAHHV